MVKFDFMVYEIDEGLWTVELPHQCDNWEITEKYEGNTREEAIIRLRAFLAEGAEALAALEAGTAFG